MRYFKTSAATSLILLLAVSLCSHADAGLIVASETEQLSSTAGNLEGPMEDAPREVGLTFGMLDDKIQGSESTTIGQSFGLSSVTVFQLAQHADTFGLTDSKYCIRGRSPPDHVPDLKV